MTDVEHTAATSRNGHAAPAAGASAPGVPPAPGSTTPARGLEGFDGIVDFVVRTTSAIWDHKNPGLIAEWYTPTTVVHTSDGDVYGRDTVIANSIAKMAAFPDIKDHVEDTIWAGDDERGYLTSMRWTWTARNTGWSVYGPPTGRRVTTRGIAHCVVVDGRYVEEWVAYDELSTLRQLGVDVRAELRRQALAGVPAPVPAGEVDRLLGQDAPPPLPPAPGDADPVDVLVRTHLHELWNRRMIGSAAAGYAPNVVVHGPDGRELYGVGDVVHDVLQMIAMLPDARYYVDELYSNQVDAATHKVAVRWTLVGTHTGPSRYGRPTGRRVRILGMDHLRLRAGVIEEVWSVWSEFNLMKQLHLAAGDTGDAP